MKTNGALATAITTALAVAAASLLMLSCSSVTGPGGPTRTYAMGFTPYPYALTEEAYIDTWTVIATDGDMVALHYDGGVPWEEALDGTPYAADFQDGIDYSASAVPPGHVRYVAVTPISGTRDGLALHRGDEPNEPLEPPWDSYPFDDPDVIDAYRNHCDRMIEALDPDYFAYGIEVNSLAWLAPEDWDAFVTLASQVYTYLKGAHPGLPVFLTFQADAFHRSPSSQTQAIEDVLPYTDVVAVSGYPFTDGLEDPQLLRSDYWSALADLAPEKPFAVAETGWPAQPLEAPYWMYVYADEQTQLEYVQRLFDDCDYLDAVFITWFFSRDYDELWEDYFQYEPDAPILRTWRDTGLYAGDGTARQSLGLWLLTLERQLATP